MATFNNSHHESGGVVLFQGELILLFCENVNLSIVEKNESETGKLFLTTHRMVFINSKMGNRLKSLSIPFYTMHDLSLEQPIFGANYIKGKTKEAGQNNTLTFKLKFTTGGATEYGQALLNAAKAVSRITQAPGYQPPPPYNPNPAASFYQAPPNVYQPAYNCGFALPTDQFNQPPPAGFIFTSELPPPYPGLNTNKDKPGYPKQGPPQEAPIYPIGDPIPQPGFGFGQPVYPPQMPQQPPAGGYGQPGFGGPQPGYAPQQQPGYAPPQQPAYPASQANGYPGQPGAYGQPPQNDQRQQQSAPLYPNLNDLGPAPSAPPM